MAVAPEVYTAIPVPTDDPASIVQAVMRIKQNIEASHNFPRVTPVQRPTLVNVQIGAMISRITP
jgi:hypothetical protein